MNWDRIKTILIVLFLFTDIFLAASIFTAKKEETKISPEVVDAAVKILNQNNISIDKSVIPTKFTQASVLQADNVISDYKSFAQSVLGDSFSSDGEGKFYTENAELTLSGDSFDFKLTENQDTSEAYSQSEAQKAVFSYLAGLGFDLSDAKVILASSENGVCNMKIRGFDEKLPIYSSEIKISASKNEIISFSGSWFNKRDNAAQDSTLKSITSILVDFSALYDGASRKSITSIESGYSVFDSATYHKSASLIPVTKITLDDKMEYFMDSRASE